MVFSPLLNKLATIGATPYLTLRRLLIGHCDKTKTQIQPGSRFNVRSSSTLPSNSTIPFEHIPDPISQKAPKQFCEQQLKDRYAHMKKWLLAGQMSSNVRQDGVYANDELNLKSIDVYGFDYDYTLAQYRNSVEELIHRETKEILVEQMKYPEEVLHFRYNPKSVIRGLHYDVKTGLLMKLDCFSRIELGTVYRGNYQLTDKEVFEMFHQRHLPSYAVEHSKDARFVQLVDAFSKPQMSILSDLVQFFDENIGSFQPEAIFADVNTALSQAHPRFHKIAAEYPERILQNDHGHKLVTYLDSLRANGKKTFVITNSPFRIVNKGMIHMLGENWRDLFDVVIIQAKKPGFFQVNNTTSFREFIPEQNSLKMSKIDKLEKGKIYTGGAIKEFQNLTQWVGDRVLYFGDHVYADLADLSMNHGWRTGAVIEDLEEEVTTMNTEDYKRLLNWTSVLKHNLIENIQNSPIGTDEEGVNKLLDEWSKEYQTGKIELKEKLNKKFGSVFRCKQNPSFFSRRLFSCSDIYTSKITNMKDYAIDYTFYPRRGMLPHEFSVASCAVSCPWFDDHGNDQSTNC